MTSKFFHIYSVYKNSQILSLQLSNASCDLSSRISNKLLNTQVSLSYTNNCCYLFCYLFLKLREIIKENVSITLFRVTTEWLLMFSTLYRTWHDARAIARARAVTHANQEKRLRRAMKTHPKVKLCGLIRPRQILKSSSRINFNWFNIINLDWFFLPQILRP